MDKDTLRQATLKSRQEVPEALADEWSRMIATRLQDLVEWENVSSVHVYRSRPEWHEVDTAWLAGFLADNWPHVELTIGDISRTAQLPSASYDLIIVPMVAFDDDCNRLGLGGGWYDRFLETQPQALMVGLAYQLQRAAKIPTESHDMALDHVATEARVITR